MRHLPPLRASYITGALTAALVTAGVLAWTMSTSTAERPPDQGNPEIRRQLGLPPGLNIATPEPRPAVAEAAPVNVARTRLQSLERIGDVVRAAESGDVDQLLALLVTEQRDGVEVAIHDDAFQYAWSIERVRLVFETLGPLSLTLASRTGAGDTYYIAFTRPAVVDTGGEEGGGIPADGIGFTVRPGEARPIVSFSLLSPGWNALQWVQVYSPDKQVLITPESLDGWRGQGDDRYVPPGYFDN